jgi:hypothetical protein
MSEKKYVVPQGMLDAAYQYYPASFAMPAVRSIVEAALQWLAENPMEPSDDQIGDIVKRCISVYPKWRNMTEWSRAKIICMEWQSSMVLSVDTDAPIIDLIYHQPLGIPVVLDNSSVSVSDDVNGRIREAYRRGQKAGS